VNSPRLTKRLLQAMQSALVAAEACIEPENDHPDVDPDDFTVAGKWVAHQIYMRTRRDSAHAEGKGAK